MDVPEMVAGVGPVGGKRPGNRITNPMLLEARWRMRFSNEEAVKGLRPLFSGVIVGDGWSIDASVER